MVALFSLLIVITLSVIVVRIGGMAFELTGLSSEIATFQAQSAFSGTGFTTEESESIVKHPVRRNIARILMLLGTAGLTSSITTLILTFIGQTGEELVIRAAILTTGVLLLFLFSKSKAIYNITKKAILPVLKKTISAQMCDYAEILGISRGYNISRSIVKKDSWMVNRKLKNLKLELEGILVLAVHRVVSGEEKFIGVPTGETEIREGDILICYGRDEAARELSARLRGPEGDREHVESVKQEERIAKVRKGKEGYS